VSDCLRPAPAALLNATFRGSRRIDLGLPDSAQSVLVEVKVSRAAHSGMLRLSAGRGTVELRVPARRTVIRQLEVPVAQDTRLTARLSTRARLRIGQMGYTFP